MGVCKYLKGGYRMDGASFFFFQCLPVPGQEAVGRKWNTGGSP